MEVLQRKVEQYMAAEQFMQRAPAVSPGAGAGGAVVATADAPAKSKR